MGPVAKGEVELPENGVATECGIILGGFPVPPGMQKLTLH